MIWVVAVVCLIAGGTIGGVIAGAVMGAATVDRSPARRACAACGRPVPWPIGRYCSETCARAEDAPDG